MRPFHLLSVILAFLVHWPAPAADLPFLRGFSLTEIGEQRYDAAESDDPNAKTPAQRVVDRLYELGVRHVSLTPRAKMTDPRGSAVVPFTEPGQMSAERRRYGRLIRYIHGKGMTVGIRPIFFVVDAQGHTPYVEEQADGTRKTWWHGNIQPADPNAWFESYRQYLDFYMDIARRERAEVFTLGAELYSMTVGIEDQWMAQPHGFPGRWVELLRFARTRLGDGTAVMYDINFTDDSFQADGIEQFGGEFARWKYRLVDLKDPNNEYWNALSEFWRGLDAVGIDIYRSLATDNQILPQSFDPLVQLLKQASDRYAGQIDQTLFEIEEAVGERKDVALKEVGFRSVYKGFIRPFEYAGAFDAVVNLDHQAAAYDSMLRSFFAPGFDWFKGAVFWDVSVDESLHGPQDAGFSPLGKEPTEAVIRQRFLTE